MSKVVKPLLVVAAIAVNVIPGIGQLASLGLLSATATTAIATVTALGISAGLSIVQGALTPSPKVALAQLERLNSSLNPTAGRKMVVGKHVAMATDIRYVEPSGSNQEYIDYIICVAAHKVTSIDEIWIDDKKAWDSGTVQGSYAGYLTVNTVLEGNSGNTISINGGAKWGSTRRLTGCAYVHLRIKRTGNSKKAESPFAGGLSNRLTIIGDGMPVYNPAYDSTVGGSGSQRADDCSTWAFDVGGNEQGANTALQALSYQLGWKINGKVSVGVGTPPARLDLYSFTIAANACDATVLTSGGSQKRYTSAGIFPETDGAQTVLSGLMSACNGAIVDTGGKLGLKIRTNDLAIVTVDLNEDDILGAGNWEPYPEINESYNIVRGRYCDPSDNALFQLVDYPEIRLASPDGQDRVLPLDLPLTDDAARAQRIAKQVLQRQQYRGKFTANFGARAWNAKVGDIVRVTLSAAGWEEKLFRVESQTIRMDGAVPMILREENEAIYQWDADDQAPVTPIAPTPYDPLNNPLILAIGDADSAAASAAVDAAAAQADATSALSKITTIVSDSILDKSEKPAVVQEYNGLVFEQGGIDTRATAYGITTEKTTYDTAISALTTYLQGLGGTNPNWAYKDYTLDTTITRATFITKFTDVYTARQALLNKIAEIAGQRANWTGVTSRPKMFRVVAKGNTTTYSPHSTGLFDESDASLSSPGRSYTVVVFTRSTGAFVSSTTYDVFGSSGNAATMASALNALGNDKIVVVYTDDEPQTNITSGLKTAMYRCGASPAVFGSTNLFRYRSAYVLIGIPGIGEGKGYEAYAGKTDSATDAWLDVAFSIYNSAPLVTGMAYTNSSVKDLDFVAQMTDTTTPVGSITVGDVQSTINSGGGVAANKVTTPAIVNNSVSQTTMQTMGGTLTGSGAYAWQDAISYNLTMPYAGDAIFDGDLAQSYSSGVLPQAWETRVTVDGTPVRTKGGAGWGTDSASIGCAKTGITAGMHTVKLQWRGDNANLSLLSATLSITAPMK